ncbi:MAG: signal peptidase II [Actinomycetota bacterium]|nr:signal peptidase II [Actinomycetota bacterium]
MRRYPVALFTAAAVVVGLDQLTKQLALSGLDDGPIDLVGSLRLFLTFNDSAAFSIGGGRTSWIAALGLVIAAVVLIVGLRADDRLTAIGYGTLFGGAAGNLTDRIFRDGNGALGGRVVDFVDPGWWPVFNVADVALWVGIAVLLVAARRRDRADAEPAASGAPTATST